MGVCLVLLGYIIGAALFGLPIGEADRASLGLWELLELSFFGEDGINGGMIGATIALCIAIVLSLVSYFKGDSIILRTSKAVPVSHDIHPQLFNVVEEMKIAANLPVMPKIYIIASPAPNAFATGIKTEKCAVAITAGLLSKLNRDELQGVIAHEMSHIVNRDILFMTFAGVMLGSMVLISEVFLRGLWYSGSSRRYSSRRSSGSGGGALVVIAIVVAILVPILTRLLYFAISRKREYLADASAARLTRYPDGLASALGKISGSTQDIASANKVTAPMYIVNPLKKKGLKLSNLTSTHPPLDQRIRILRKISGGTNYADYQKSFSSVTGKSAAIIPPSGLMDLKNIPIRDASSVEQKKPDKKKDLRDVGDLMRAVNNYAFLMCVCGLKLKIPPEFNKPKVACPRCKREIKSPHAELAEIAAVAGATVAGKKPKAQKTAPRILTYRRKGIGWESFSCTCGSVQQISPAFNASSVLCNKCNKKIKIT